VKDLLVNYLANSRNSFLRRLADMAIILAMCWFAAYAARAAELKVPQQVVAGQGFSIATSGSGSETFYLIGPAHVAKRDVKIGEPIVIAGEEVRAAGRYVALLGKGEGAARAVFYVAADKPANINFLARPSRVAAAKPGAISGVAFVFDQFNNAVLAPTPVKFNLSVEGGAPVARTVKTQNGIAWTRMDSGRKAGAAQFVASVGETSVRRVVEQVAADACNLRLKAQRKDDVVGQNTKGIEYLFRKNKITWAKGRGTLKAGNVVEVRGAPPENTVTTYQAKHVIIATGSVPIELPFLKFDEQRVLSNIGALSIPSVPGHLIVIGGGVIGLELGSVWRRLGARVTVVELLPAILPGMDDEVVKDADKALRKQGLEIRTGTKVVPDLVAQAAEPSNMLS